MSRKTTRDDHPEDGQREEDAAEGSPESARVMRAFPCWIRRLVLAGSRLGGVFGCGLLGERLDLDASDAVAGHLGDGEAAAVEVERLAHLRDLSTQLRWTFPREAGVETLAGFLLFHLGHIPQVGETLDFDCRRYTIAEMAGHRIARVNIETIATKSVRRISRKL